MKKHQFAQKDKGGVSPAHQKNRVLSGPMHAARQKILINQVIYKINTNEHQKLPENILLQSFILSIARTDFKDCMLLEDEFRDSSWGLLITVFRRSANAEATAGSERGKASFCLPGQTLGGDGVGTAIGTPTLPLPLFSRLLLRLLGWLPPLLPLLL